ncbi:helix-turn-helix domain-containing protein [Frankia sp. CNm7]|uniref:Helix-turn-helix domain-containing protein n=1 Tax=Frankia nepalensis TaxID=1836974 RepID=A0A937RNQ2_9ACTN|nr:helix-turn-helix domain-containing protein [Frankia nepalensis]MBL7501959.1 helix-turn-helix domain-containing protein [Frankia nepalensis]MBL7510589.1 helix-turn-helix domain-containing protein [Frankia nepalensis]MBL7517329.1 helix-turn-helix domain-containing protein [Frankia nepalensis]MBL7633412.1 helix-turn-helix domain-containing protein [Frankia nepalensis]
MTGVQPDWILALAPRDPPERVPEPACSAVTIAVATALLGPGPVAWAVQTALKITDDIVQRVPEHGGGSAPLATLRSSVESTVLLALRSLLEDIPPGSGAFTEQAATAEAIVAGGEFARRGIPLDRVLRGVRIGHSRLHHELVAVIDFLPEPVRRAESHRVSDLLFAYADAHASRLAEEYIAERARWEAGREAERRRIVEALLAGKDLPGDTASATLGYELTRYHQAFVVTAGDRHAAVVDLQRCAEHLSHALAADGWISLSVVPGQVWAWAGWRAKPAPDYCDQARSLRPPPGARVAAGLVAFGPEGLRRSHLEAREADRIATAARTGWWCDYTEVRTLCLATADHEQARWYAEDVLGPLLADNERARELRETLRVYLACERSLRTAAEQLHLARNTVTYRIHKAEDLLGHLIGDPMELRLALEIARVLDAERKADH